MAQLSTLFLLLACLVWSNWLVARDFDTRGTLRMLFKSVVLVVAATLSKENGALFPLLFGLLAWFGWQQLRREGQPIPAGFRFGVRALVLAPILIGLAILAVSPELALGSYASRDFTLSERLATQGKILWFYVRLFLLPTPSAMGLFHDDIEIIGPGSLQALLAWGAWLAALTAAILARSRVPLLSFAVIWYLCAHAMESSIFGLELAYEHRNYLALIGPALALSAGMSAVLDRLGRSRLHGFGVVMLILAALTLSRSLQWSDTHRFFAAEFRNHPNSPRALLSAVGQQYAQGAPPEWYVAQIPRLREAHDDAIWPLLIHASLQCSNPDHPVPWQQIQSEIRSGKETFQLDSQVKVIIGRLVEDSCPHLDTRPFLDFLRLARLRAQTDGESALARAFSIFLAWTYRELGDYDNAEIWYRQAAAEAPPARVEELFELAYFLLNQGRTERLPEVIDAIERRRQQFRLPIGYRLDEVRQHYATLQRESGLTEE
jgi:tetratricopeptide (TPR) repeat protein